MDTPLKANLKLVTADTKLLDEGKGDGIFVKTSGIGTITANRRTTPQCPKNRSFRLADPKVACPVRPIRCIHFGLSINSPLDRPLAVPDTEFRCNGAWNTMYPGHRSDSQAACAVVVVQQPRPDIPSDTLRLCGPHAQARDKSLHCPTLGGCARYGIAPSFSSRFPRRALAEPDHPLQTRFLDRPYKPSRLRVTIGLRAGSFTQATPLLPAGSATRP